MNCDIATNIDSDSEHLSQIGTISQMVIRLEYGIPYYTVPWWILL